MNFSFCWMKTLVWMTIKKRNLLLFFFGATFFCAAMLVNRVGDFGLALKIMGCFTIFQTINFFDYFCLKTINVF